MTEEQKRQWIIDHGLNPDEYEVEVIPRGSLRSQEQGSALQPTLRPTSSFAGAVGRGFKRSAIPTGIGLGSTAGVAALISAGLIPVTGGVSATALPIIAGIGGGLGAGYLQEKLKPTTPEEAAQMQADYEQQKTGSYIGELLPSALAFRPSISGIKAAFGRVPTGTTPEAAQAMIRNARIGMGVGAGLGAGTEVMLPAITGEEIDPERVALSAGLMGSFTKPWGIGAKLFPGHRGAAPGKPQERLAPTLDPAAAEAGMNEAGPIVDKKTRTPIDEFLKANRRQPGKPVEPEAGQPQPELTPKPEPTPQPPLAPAGGQAPPPVEPTPAPVEPTPIPVEPAAKPTPAQASEVGPAPNPAWLTDNFIQNKYGDWVAQNDLVLLRKTGKKLFLNKGDAISAQTVEQALQEISGIESKPSAELSPTPLQAPQPTPAPAPAPVPEAKPVMPEPTPLKPLGGPTANTPMQPTPQASRPPTREEVFLNGYVGKLKAATETPWLLRGVEYDDVSRPMGAKKAPLKKNIDEHRKLVAKALAEGKQVPPEVLADYPELTPKGQGTPKVRLAELTSKMEAGQKLTPKEQKEYIRLRNEATGQQPEAVMPKVETTIRQGKVGDKLKEGEVVLTSSGRKTTPFPKLSFGTERKTSATAKRVDAWLRENAIAEAKARGDDFNGRAFESENPSKMPQATKDSMEEYLFGSNERYQAAVENVSQLSPEQLLAHPANRDLLSWFERLAARLDIEAKRTGKIIGSDGMLKRGLALIKERIAKWNGNLATLDSLSHEIAHIFLDDLRLSTNPALRALYERGVRIFGSEEALTQAVGLRATELVKARVDGNVLARFKLWARDFWSAIKAKWMTASEADLRNLMARRMVDAEARGATIPQAEVKPTGLPNERYQGTSAQQASARRAAQSEDLTKNMRQNEMGISFLQSVMTRVAKIPIGGPYLERAFNRVYDINNRMLGLYRNQAVSLLAEFTPKERATVIKRLMDDQDSPSVIRPPLSERESLLYSGLRNVFDESGNYANQQGIRIQDFDAQGNVVWRPIHMTGRYMPHKLNQRAYDIMTKGVGTQAYDDMHQAWMDWAVPRLQLRQGVNRAKALVRAEKMWDAQRSAFVSIKERISGDYGALEKPAGIGLPEIMREMDPEKLINGYFNRYAQKMGWHEAVQKVDPKDPLDAERAIVRALLDEPDQFGVKKPAQLPDGTRVQNIATMPDVQHLRQDVFKQYSGFDKIVEAANNVVKSFMLQTITGATDLISSFPLAAQHLGLGDYGKMIKGLLNFREGVAKAYQWNVLQRRMNRFQNSTEGGAIDFQTSRINGIADWFNKFADGIYLITGRNFLEHMGRGTLMYAGLLKTEESVGRILSNSWTKNDVLWLDKFVGRGVWEPLLKNGDRLTPELAEQAAARFVQSVQGEYNARGLPHWAMSGPVAPFANLAKWNIEKGGDFFRHVIGPIRHKNFGPLLKMAFMGGITGEGVALMRQVITGKKSQDADWTEIVDAGGKDAQYRLLSSAVYCGFSGVYSDMVKVMTDTARGRQPMGWRWPVVSAISQTSDRAGQLSYAIQQGENPVTALTRFFGALGKDNVQMARALLRLANEEEAAMVEHSNAMRDLRVFRDLNDIPQIPLTKIQANPMLNPLKRQYQRSTSPAEIAQLAPQLTKQAFQRGEGDRARIAALLNNYRASARDLVPSPRTQFPQFQQYLNFIERTQGPEARAVVLRNYLRKERLDKMRRQLIPRLTVPGMDI